MRARAITVLLIAAALSGSLIAFAAPSAPAPAPSAPQSVTAKVAAVGSAASSVAKLSHAAAGPLAGFDPLRHRLEGAQLVADLPEGRLAELTLDPRLQAAAEKVLRDYEVPYAALVAIEPSTGRVLAYVSHSSTNPEAGDLARDPSPPAASVFKVVTGSALIDRGIGPEQRVCYSGGSHRLYERDLGDDPARDKSCATLGEAMGSSINSIFAKLADRSLPEGTLERYAEAFGFGHALPFDAPTRPSPAEVPADRLERARTAAGFWHMHMSPLHAALIAATFANGGAMPRPAMVRRVLDAHGKPLYSHAPSSFRNVVSRATARSVGHMMTETVAHGTSRSAFHDPKGQPFLPGIAVAGKTGSLSSESPYRAYSWFIGYAPEDRPRIALAALVVNTPKWRIKSSYLAREALRNYLIRKP